MKKILLIVLSIVIVFFVIYFLSSGEFGATGGRFNGGGASGSW